MIKTSEMRFLQSEQVEFCETVMKRLKIDPHFMLDQPFISSPQIAYESPFVKIFQHTNAADDRQTFFVRISPSPPFINQDQISR